ncbi:hypothetical protein MKK84_06895 [Methylobacterium sp. E-065]|uniref:hypothetical protein n=1 Tax=Methylobacterium sp. E-065 TaxID=2836583 RepID=UPI001FB9E5BB|nr:hypothetical protein [Methylobacterium sp. E-065]MCJ2017150.1 hypothetical protein [Methylobacterium sp. E-065]
MPVLPERKLSDAELDQLARELFAEVRAQHAEKPRGKSGGDATADVGVDLLDWLLGDSDDAGDGDSGD